MTPMLLPSGRGYFSSCQDSELLYCAAISSCPVGILAVVSVMLNNWFSYDSFVNLVFSARSFRACRSSLTLYSTLENQ